MREKEGLSLVPSPIVFSQFNVSSAFAWLVPLLNETQTKNTAKKPSTQSITQSNLQFLWPSPLLSAS